MEAHKSRLKYSNIPKRYLDARLSDFSVEISKDIEKFITCTGWASLLVLGPVGTGKTHLACAIAHEVAKTNTVLYTTLYGMSQKVMADMNDYSKKEQYKHRGAEIFQKVGILIIDEMGRSFATDAEKNRLFDIINYTDMKIYYRQLFWLTKAKMNYFIVLVRVLLIGLGKI
jgi:DNA replication protein DnaC